jgi:hypothetical protein
MSISLYYNINGQNITFLNENKKNFITDGKKQDYITIPINYNYQVKNNDGTIANNPGKFNVRLPEVFSYNGIITKTDKGYNSSQIVIIFPMLKDKYITENNPDVSKFCGASRDPDDGESVVNSLYHLSAKHVHEKYLHLVQDNNKLKNKPYTELFGSRFTPPLHWPVDKITRDEKDGNPSRYLKLLDFPICEAKNGQPARTVATQTNFYKPINFEFGSQPLVIPKDKIIGIFKQFLLGTNDEFLDSIKDYIPIEISKKECLKILKPVYEIYPWKELEGKSFYLIPDVNIGEIYAAVNKPLSFRMYCKNAVVTSEPVVMEMGNSMAKRICNDDECDMSEMIGSSTSLETAVKNARNSMRSVNESDDDEKVISATAAVSTKPKKGHSTDEVTRKPKNSVEDEESKEEDVIIHKPKKNIDKETDDSSIPTTKSKKKTVRVEKENDE